MASQRDGSAASIREPRAARTTRPSEASAGSRAPRGSDADDVAFAWAEQGGEDLILLLEPTDKGWKVVGLER